MLSKYIKGISVAAVLLLTGLQAAYSQGLYITNGSRLVGNGTVKIVLNNCGFTNNGTFTPGSSEVVFTGGNSTSGSFIAGTASTSFYNLTLNKTANGIQLNRNIGVSNSILFSSGDSLFLNNNIIDLGGTGVLTGETSAKRITGRTGGYIQATHTLNAPSDINPGNLGYRITSSANLGSTVVKRGHQQQSGASVYRYYDVVPANNENLNATVSMYYFHNELGTVPEGNLGLFYSINGGTVWANLGATSLNTTDDYLTKSGVNSLSRFTLSNISEPLAVKLLYFKGSHANGSTLLNWATASEISSSHFDIESAADGVSFKKIGSVDALGSSSTVQVYEYPDRFPYAGITYYRLKLVDRDAAFKYSPIVAVIANDLSEERVRIFPNPVAGTYVTVSFYSENRQVLVIQLYSANGKLIRSASQPFTNGHQSITLEIGDLPAGIYTLKVTGKNYKTVQFIKE